MDYEYGSIQNRPFNRHECDLCRGICRCHWCSEPHRPEKGEVCQINKELENQVKLSKHEPKKEEKRDTSE